MATKADWTAFIELAKSADIFVVAKDLLCDLKKNGVAEFCGPCPMDGGRDRFSLNTRKQVFNCRGSDDGGKGDVIALCRHVTGCSFPEALERITGQRRPDSTRDETIDERAERLKKNALRIEASRRRQEVEIAQAAVRARHEEEAVSKIIDRSVAIFGTHAESYVVERGLVISKRHAPDLRFVDKLEYWGVPDNGTKDLVLLGAVPALIALIRDVYGDVIGISQTFLDPKEPRKWRPDGSHRNSPKKVRGKKQGGMIRLGRTGSKLAIGEGWENPLAWWQMAQNYIDPDVTLAAAVDIGNLCGGSLGKVQHPTANDPDGVRERMPSGLPDPDAPGVIIPDGVQEIILICDANSDGYKTAAFYRTAVNRFQDAGVKVDLAWPPAGYDWNDILKRELERA
jgi:CHC2 zinc finger